MKGFICPLQNVYFKAVENFCPQFLHLQTYVVEFAQNPPKLLAKMYQVKLFSLAMYRQQPGKN